MTLQELEPILKGISAEQLAAFLQRGQRLTKRQELESKISNLRVDLQKYGETINAQIQSIEGEIATLQKEIDALGG